MLRKVPIKNIYYMLCYVWDRLTVDKMNKFSIDTNIDIFDFYGNILVDSLSYILKNGLLNQYVEVQETDQIIRGKIDFSTTLKKNTLLQNKVVCNHDDYIANNIYNQILKATINNLLKKSIALNTKKQLKYIYASFEGIDLIEIENDIFNKLFFSKSEEYYAFPVKICQLVYNSVIISEKEGDISFYEYLEENMHNIFELFIYKVLKKEQKQYTVKHGTYLYWEFASGNTNLVPIMKLDIELSNSRRKVIIDTKYYENVYQENYKNTFKSAHLYQIFTYLNKINFEGIIDGILVYPHNLDGPEIDEIYSTKIISKDKIKDSTIRLYSIDLNREWSTIKERVLNLIK